MPRDISLLLNCLAIRCTSLSRCLSLSLHYLIYYNLFKQPFSQFIVPLVHFLSFSFTGAFTTVRLLIPRDWEERERRGKNIESTEKTFVMFLSPLCTHHFLVKWEAHGNLHLVTCAHLQASRVTQYGERERERKKKQWMMHRCVLTQKQGSELQCALHWPSNEEVKEHVTAAHYCSCWMLPLSVLNYSPLLSHDFSLDVVL